MSIVFVQADVKITKRMQKAYRAPKRVRAEQRPSPCTIVTAQGIGTINFTEAGKPTEDSARKLAELSTLPLPTRESLKALRTR